MSGTREQVDARQAIKAKIGEIEALIETTVAAMGVVEQATAHVIHNASGERLLAIKQRLADVRKACAAYVVGWRVIQGELRKELHKIL